MFELVLSFIGVVLGLSVVAVMVAYVIVLAGKYPHVALLAVFAVAAAMIYASST